MSWTIRFDEHAAKQIRKLDKETARRILTYLEEVSTLEDPTTRGAGLFRNLSGLWKYRVGDYRVICDIQMESISVLVVEVGHRSDVYS